MLMSIEGKLVSKHLLCHWHVKEMLIEELKLGLDGWRKLNRDTQLSVIINN
ncbi:hypothetical protein QG37_05841 [Candidozyma auris]|uniref:Uncharacterized protein n=1 Tax=Candidozyma auris TaxID=498019 RepID=A0A0L0NTF8_CANAR|nr:hypothetical protein QG37_05841 [[Candida] auris]